MVYFRVGNLFSASTSYSSKFRKAKEQESIKVSAFFCYRKYRKPAQTVVGEFSRSKPIFYSENKPSFSASRPADISFLGTDGGKSFPAKENRFERVNSPSTVLSIWLFFCLAFLGCMQQKKRKPGMSQADTPHAFLLLG